MLVLLFKSQRSGSANGFLSPDLPSYFKKICSCGSQRPHQVIHKIMTNFHCCYEISIQK